MKNSFKKLMREQIQERLDTFGGNSAPKDGWIRIIREALGMSSYQLAKKIGCSQPNIIAIEKSEKNGTISLEKLENVARALNCRLVYGLIPLQPLNEMLENQARMRARKQIKIINHSMSLEEQGLNPRQLSEQEEALVQELLQGNPRELWKKDEN